MTDRNMENAMLDISIDHVLAQQPPVAIPANFAARVAAQAAALPQRKPARQARYGRIAVFAAASLLLVALFALAPFAGSSPTSAGFLAEMVVLAQLGGLVYWLGRTPREMF
jgi:hypothetical protein